MEYEEERHARGLHRALSHAFESVADIQVSVGGNGVHWACVSTRGGNSCSTSCFDVGGPEYLTSFDRGDQTEAWGRTFSQTDTVAAVTRWLAGDGTPALHAQFEFVDQNQRALSAIVEEVIRLRPRLLGAAEVRHQMCDLNELWFTLGDRTCEVSFYGDDPAPNATFSWDGCEIFQFQADDSAALAQVLDRWLVDRLMPSAMAEAFPWLQMLPVAQYHEEGRGVEGEFLGSWDSIEQFYRELNGPSPLQFSP